MPTGQSTEKVIIANRRAMAAKYGAVGLAAIDAALGRLIAADAARGLTTKVVRIDNAGDMAAVGGAPVIAPVDQRGAKAAVDAVYGALNPDYIVLLDGPDTVPHIDLQPIVGLTDDDLNIPSDLPYASSAGFGTGASSFLAVERVVGRLPTPEGEDDSAVLVRLIDLSIAHAPSPQATHLRYFGLSADVWTISTQLSVSALFGNNTALQLSPPAGHPVIDPSLALPSHFINCHGASANPQFFGQQGNAFPIAMRSSGVAATVVGQSAVVAAECCYGAQLYNYKQVPTDQPICMAYLRAGAIAFLGSTNIAYGPTDSSGQADLMCQFFWEAVLKGASTGRALLQARQKFIQTQVMSTVTNLKTLAQFLLLGDPSLVAVTPPKDAAQDELVATAAPGSPDAASQRKMRRTALASNGRSTAESASLPGKAIKRGASKAADRFRAIAARRGYPVPVMFAVTGGRQFRHSMKGLEQKPRMMIAVDAKVRTIQGDKEVALPSVRVIVAQVLNDGIVSVIECESR